MKLTHCVVAFAVLSPLLAGTCIAQDSSLAHARHLYQQAGDFETARTIASNYVAMHPSDAVGYIDLGIYTRQAGIVGADRRLLLDATDDFQRAAGLTSDKTNQAIITGNLGTTYLELGNFERAEQYFQTAFAQSGRHFYRARMAYCEARKGNFDAAVAGLQRISIDQAMNDSPANPGLTAYNVGVVYALAHRPIQAVAWLRRAVQANGPRFRSSMRDDSDLESIRQDSTFQVILGGSDAH